MRIQAAVVRDPRGIFTIEELDLEDPRDDEVVVRVVAVGICHTDLAMRHRRAPLPVVLGHEGAGIVERVGARVTKVRPGDHVVMTFLSCGRCLTCQRGMPAYCENDLAANFAAARLDGSSGLRRGDEVIHGHFFGQSSFATHALASERNVVQVRDDLPFELLGALGCGVPTGAGAVLNSVDSRFRQSLAVFGAGTVGLSAIMAARLVGYLTIIAIDVKPNRLALALELGATHAINATTTDPGAEVCRITGRGADYAIEASGRPEVLRQAVDSLALLGVCGVIGGMPAGTEVSLDANQILFGRTVRGILGGDSIPDVFIPKLIELYLSGRFPIDRLITKYPFSGINQAATDSLSGVAIKPVLIPITS
jgi:aryl-alcohol dehydrogenase